MGELVSTNRPLRILWSFPLRAIAVVSWLVTVVTFGLWVRLAVERGESFAGVAAVVVLGLVANLPFWMGFRLRVELYRDAIVVVRLLTQRRLERAEITDVIIGRGGLWGRMLMLVTRGGGQVAIPAFQVQGDRDSASLRALLGARYEIRRWLAAPESTNTTTH